MSSQPNRHTRLPEHLDHLWEEKQSDAIVSNVNLPSLSNLPDNSQKTKSERRHPLKISIPINLTRNQQSSTDSEQHARERSPRKVLHIGLPSQKYLFSWKIDQAGVGWIGLQNSPGYSKVVIKKIHASRRETSYFRSASHRNVVSLIEAYHHLDSLYMVYEYSGFAVDLSLACSSPHVQFSESDVSTICKSILSGLEYIHSQLQICHGAISPKNILLYETGHVRIGMDLPVVRN